MAVAQRLFPRPLGPHCGNCRLLGACGGERNDDACSPRLEFTGPGGPHALHPLHPDFEIAFDAVGGHEFDDLELRPQRQRIEFRPHLPQIRWLASHRGETIDPLRFPALGIRLKEVFRDGRIRSAEEVRAYTGIAPEVALVLLLHGEDELLERFTEHDAAVAGVGVAGYALVTSPSFSMWEPRRRPNNLLSLRRSLLDCVRLQEAGASVCPRVAWANERDAERLAEWVTANSVDLVSLDLMTYGPRSFDRSVALLARFDELTGHKLCFLIDGIRARRRIEAIYLATAPGRITVSDATMARPAPVASPIDLGRTSLVARAAVVERACRHAHRAVAQQEASSHEMFVAQLANHRGLGELVAPDHRSDAA
ncbi:MAG: hypothetical protein QOH16_1472 [Gaiellaceae bacterium]|nr:hypothetical protein [Gaiellaceae bacterium]